MTYFKKDNKQFYKEYNFKQLYNYGINRLYSREYSKKELYNKMKKYQNDDKIILDVLLLLENNGYLSDKRKAQSIINNYSSKESLFKIRNRLKQLEISIDIIDELFELYEENNLENTLEIIYHLLEKKFYKYNVDNHLKMIRFLSQKGFSYDEIKKSIDLFKSK